MLSPAPSATRAGPRGAGHTRALLAVGLALALGARAKPSAAEIPPEAAPSPAPSASPPPAEVVVRAPRPLLGHSARAPSVASTVVEGEALRSPGASSTDVLMQVPGVQVSRTGSGGELATASLRGTDAKQTPVYVGGVRINDEVAGSADLSAVPLWMMDRVEVFRGNAPDDADRLGPGGAVFFWPRLPRERRLGAGLGAGTFGAREGWIGFEQGGERGALLVALRAAGADNDYRYLDDAGMRFNVAEIERRRANADLTSLDAWMVGSFDPGGASRVTALANVLRREQGVTGLSILPATRARAVTERALGGVSSSLPCPGAGARCRLRLSTTALAAGSNVTDPLGELASLGTPRLTTTAHRSAQRAELRSSVADSVELSLSVLAAAETLHIDRAQGSSNRATRISTRAATTLAWAPLATTTLFGLAAVECHGTTGFGARYGAVFRRSDRPCGVLQPSLRAGARQRLTQSLEVLGNISRNVRVPVLGELYGSSPTVSGNPALRPEVSHGADLGLRAEHRGGREGVSLALDAFAFATFSDNLVRYQRASFDTVAPFNVSRARVLGAEVAAAGTLLGLVRAQLATTVLDPRETTDDRALDPTVNDILPYTARLVVSVYAEVFAEPGLSALHQDEAAIGVRYYHRASRYADNAGLTVLPEQHLVDIEARSAWLGRDIGLRLAMRNAMDARQLDLLGLPLPGRSYHAQLEAWF